MDQAFPSSAPRRPTPLVLMETGAAILPVIAAIAFILWQPAKHEPATDTTSQIMRP